MDLKDFEKVQSQSDGWINSHLVEKLFFQSDVLDYAEITPQSEKST